MATEEPSAQESSEHQRSKQNGSACRTVHPGSSMPANAELLHDRMCGPAHVMTEQPLDFSISRRSLTPTPPSPVHDQHLDPPTQRVTHAHSPAVIAASSPARSPSPPPPPTPQQQQQQQHLYQQAHSHPHPAYHEDRYAGDTAATSTTSEPEPMPVRIPSPIPAPIPSQGYRGPGAFGAFGFSLGSVGVTAGMIAMNEAFNQSNFFSSLPPLSLSMLQQANGNNNGDNGRKAPKAVRPFKAYPRDPLSLPLGYYGLPGHYGMPVDGVVPSSLLMNDSYADYRRQMLLGQHDKDFPSSMVPSANLHHNGGDALKAINRCPPSSPAISSDNSLSPAPPMSTNGLPPALLPTPLPPTSSVRSNSPSLSPSPGLTPDTPNSNSSSKRRQRSLPDDLKDEAYWERRRKNNEAAKRSRDARRAKEDEIAIRAAFLEQENLKLRVEVAALKNETAKLRCLLYNS